MDVQWRRKNGGKSPSFFQHWGQEDLSAISSHISSHISHHNTLAILRHNFKYLKERGRGQLGRYLSRPGSSPSST